MKREPLADGFWPMECKYANVYATEACDAFTVVPIIHDAECWALATPHTTSAAARAQAQQWSVWGPMVEEYVTEEVLW